ncbi:response regulator transcription factor [Pseudomonas sp. BCA14]|uniref:response regulator transcription factor n=1 Tax=Pseudomonas sp. MWU13-2517 TaxID=2929055 RepID=UPI00106E2D84|nr:MULTISPECIES: response regulator transcription factor [unclassified Pseudomonas]TFF05933.1 response regulator transcription factor [Pseudomonas sp. JMN1]TFF08186.1 response regulator transcription factor [Pseudomonas sp. BCA17]TFF23899.1 response regulator transcription factor [Pseudomonas sp. BCA14]TFF28150.1 response regulator transcription factor [Pseudomonas sp. BCA13]
MITASDQPLRIILADDHPIFLIGLRAVLEGDEQVRIVAEANSPQALVELMQTCACDVLVTDFMMPAEPQADGLRLIGHLRRHYPDLPIVVVTMLNNAGLFHAILELGVMGLLSKASLANELPEAIRHARQRRTYVAQVIRQTLSLAGEVGADCLHSQQQLSPRELEVIRLLGAGLTVGEIATQLHRSKQTVSAQKVSAMRKLGLGNDAALFIYVQEHGLA